MSQLSLRQKHQIWVERRYGVQSPPALIEKEEIKPELPVTKSKKTVTPPKVKKKSRRQRKDPSPR